MKFHCDMITPMLNRFFVHFMILMLFAVGQIGVATHAIEHIEPNFSASHSDPDGDEHSDGLCLQCIAKSQAEQSDLPSGFSLLISDKQAEHATLELSTFASLYIELYSARAPPIYS